MTPRAIHRTTVRKVIGVGLVVLVTLLQMAAVTTGAAASTGWVAGTAISGLGLLQGLLLLRLRHRPGAVVMMVCLAYAGQAALTGVVLPAAPWLALVGLTAAAGVTGTPRMLAAALVALGAGFALGSLNRPGSAGAVPLLAAVTAILVLAGAVMAARRAGALAVAAQRAEALERLASQERLALARELHDSIGHGLSTIAVQSSAARMALEAGRAEQAARALSAVESSSRAAMREMRDLVTVLRSSRADLHPAGELDDLPGVVERIRESGVAVRLVLSPGVGALSTGTQATVYRIVQEGLTNVVRHAPGAWAEASVSMDGGVVVVSVENGGSGGPPVDASASASASSSASAVEHDGGGYGLAGLRERVQLVGGAVEAGPRAAGPGWRLTAQLPAVMEEAT